MNMSVDTNGITIKKLFSTKSIAYSDIKSITTDYRTTAFQLKSGKEIVYTKYLVISEDCPLLYDMIERYNIGYRNEHELKITDRTYTAEEVRQIWGAFESSLVKTAREAAAEKLGSGYSVELQFVESVGGTIVYLILVKDGTVIELPNEKKNDASPVVPQSFDNFYVSDLCTWDPESGRGLYSIEPDFLVEEEAKDTIVSGIEYIAETL